MIKLVAGLTIGYVLGGRAGREKYEQIVATARKAQDHPVVVRAQQKAGELLGLSSGAPASAKACEPSSPSATPADATPPRRDGAGHRPEQHPPPAPNRRRRLLNW